MTPGPVFLDAAAIAERCSPALAVQAIEDALARGLDPAHDIPRTSVPVRAGHLLVMPSEAHRPDGGGGHVGIKVAAVVPGNPWLGLPRIQATYLLMDAETLEVRAVLDGTALTSLRTPAVSVAAVRRHLLRTDGPLAVVVIGAGPQARGHVDALEATVGPHRRCDVQYLVRDPDRARPHLSSGAPVVLLGSEEADRSLRAADVVVCATSARHPLFDSSLLVDHVVVIAVGSHEPDAREVDAALCRRASVVVEDVATALREAGDVVLAVEEGALDAGDLLTIADVVTGRIEPPLDRPLLFKSVGMSWEDLVVAAAVTALR